MNELVALLQAGAEKLKVNISENQLNQFISYLELLLRWNTSFNLTAVKNPKQIVIKHFLDSIAVAPLVSGERILDVGAGAGLPGIPLALLYPDTQVVLLDSNGKKTRFMQQVVAQLGLKLVTVVQSRVELYYPEEKFDQIYSRAFSSIDEKIKKVEHLLKPQGRIMAMKGVVPEVELSKLPPRFKLISIYPLNVPDLEMQERHLVEIGFLQCG